MSEPTAYQFEVTDRPPPSKAKGGPGRPRTNPFDGPMRQSYLERFWEPTPDYPEGRWFEVPPELLKGGMAKARGQIRNSRQYLKKEFPELRSRIRGGDETGRLAFRAEPGEAVVPQPRVPSEDAVIPQPRQSAENTGSSAEYNEYE